MFPRRLLSLVAWILIMALETTAGPVSFRTLLRGAAIPSTAIMSYTKNQVSSFNFKSNSGTLVPGGGPYDRVYSTALEGSYRNVIKCMSLSSTAEKEPIAITRIDFAAVNDFFSTGFIKFIKNKLDSKDNSADSVKKSSSQGSGSDESTSPNMIMVEEFSQGQNSDDRSDLALDNVYEQLSYKSYLSQTSSKEIEAEDLALVLYNNPTCGGLGSAVIFEQPVRVKIPELEDEYCQSVGIITKDLASILESLGVMMLNRENSPGVVFTLKPEDLSVLNSYPIRSMIKSDDGSQMEEKEIRDDSFDHLDRYGQEYEILEKNMNDDQVQPMIILGDKDKKTHNLFSGPPSIKNYDSSEITQAEYDEYIEMLQQEDKVKMLKWKAEREADDKNRIPEVD